MRTSSKAKIAWAALALLAAFLVPERPLQAADASPFEALPGRWSGEGRLGFKDGKVENVTCRVTYFLSDDKQEVKQNIRCASPSGKIEVKSAVTNKAGILAGTWSETVYNLSGDLAGEATKNGLKVQIKGEGMTADMQILVKEATQIIEIHFESGTLLGLSLLLKKDAA